jgi:hypothetical protein
MGQLMEGEYAARGTPNAPVTMVLFSDFQCPYCKRMKELIDAEPLLKPGGSVRLVFRHMPMAQHAWAQHAAEAAACAEFQGPTVFWALHDRLFESQDTITAADAEKRINDLATGVPGVDVRGFQECLKRQMSLGTVVRDTEMGNRNADSFSQWPTIAGRAQRRGTAPLSLGRVKGERSPPDDIDLGSTNRVTMINFSMLFRVTPAPVLAGGGGRKSSALLTAPTRSRAARNGSATFCDSYMVGCLHIFDLCGALYSVLLPSFIWGHTQQSSQRPILATFSSWSRVRPLSGVAPH